MENDNSLQKNIEPCSYFLPHLIFLVLILLAYSSAIQLGYFQDDYTFSGLDEWRFYSYANYWRPLWTLVLAIQYTLFGLNPPPYHLVLLVLYFINACVAFHVLTMLGLTRLVSTFSVGLWILMAGNTYVAVWISHVSTSLSMLFTLVATLLLLYGFRREKIFIPCFLVATIIWFLSMFVKEVGVLWCFGAIAAGIYFWKSRNKNIFFLITFITIPLLFLSLFFLLRIHVQGRFSPEFAEPSLVSELPFFLFVAGRTIHYFEGIVYNFLPLDIFNSLFEIILFLGIFILLLICLYVNLKKRSNKLKGFLILAICWLLMFSVHACISPHPRNLYIPTLGSSVIICIILFSQKNKNLIKINMIIFLLYMAMHVYSGKNVMHVLSSRSEVNLRCIARFLKFGEFYPDKLKYLKKELRFTDIERLAKAPLIHDIGIWRKFVRKLFKATVKK